jgi:hypothetical protein
MFILVENFQQTWKISTVKDRELYEYTVVEIRTSKAHTDRNAM